MNPAQYILVGLVRLYRWTLSPASVFIFGARAQCRFTPSCSQYAIEALQLHGACHGSWLAAKRVCRCHPWGDCGDDPVPRPESDGRKTDGRENVIASAAIQIEPRHSN